MMVLWLLILRGTSIEFRNHVKSKVWDPLWDFVFCASSLLLAVFFGAALANVVRGVSPRRQRAISSNHCGLIFSSATTSEFSTGNTILVGVLALAVLVMHGALWRAHENRRAGKRASRDPGTQEYGGQCSHSP